MGVEELRIGAGQGGPKEGCEQSCFGGFEQSLWFPFGVEWDQVVPLPPENLAYGSVTHPARRPICLLMLGAACSLGERLESNKAASSP